jgi:ribosomal protein S26
MSIQVIHKCDRCGATATTSKEISELKLQDVAIGIKNVHYSSPYYTYYLQDNLKREKQFCMKCCIELGIEPVLKNASSTVVTPPSFEDLIREMIREEIENK